jgi:ribosomal-protein-alanine N-acetyltransferase
MTTRARLRGAQTLFLEVRRTNTVARALYRSFGFEEIGIRRDYYPAARGREDARVLALDLE